MMACSILFYSLSLLYGLATASPVLQSRDDVPAGYVAAPYYPAPYGGWVSNWTASYEKAAALVGQMTLAEKANLTAGTGIYMGT